MTWILEFLKGFRKVQRSFREVLNDIGMTFKRYLTFKDTSTWKTPFTMTHLTSPLLLLIFPSSHVSSLVIL